jgi:NhaP-type Na+/H+ or K+/H+ antiporter
MQPGSLTLWTLMAAGVVGAPATMNLTDSGSGSVPGSHKWPNDTSNNVILFIIVSFLGGCIISHFSARYCHWLPYSPALLVFGMLLWILDNRTILAGHAKIDVGFHDSLVRLGGISGRLILHIFLPPLLFADCISMDWHVVKRTIGQTFILAFPGIVVVSILQALVCTFALPYHWDWMLSCTFGAVLACTDTVAVLTMLKELGAPASVTAIVAGESLFNDGTSIVLYTIFFKIYKNAWANPNQAAGVDAGQVIGVLAQLILGAVALGVAFYVVLYCWLSLVSRRVSDGDSTIQVGITVLGVYACFFLGESSVMGVSGVIAVVVMSLLLAGTAWPIIADKTHMLLVWHSIEWMFLTVFFVLVGLIVAGAIFTVRDCGEEMSLPGAPDYETLGICYSDLPWVLVTYVTCVLIRFVTIFFFLPLLRTMGWGLTVSNAILCSFGGLRGGVGIALALQMSADLTSMGKDRTGKLVLLHVAGVVLLTMVINAPLSPPLLRALGVAKVSETKKNLLKDIARHVHTHGLEKFLRLRQNPEWAFGASSDSDAKVVGTLSFLANAINQDAWKQQSGAQLQEAERAMLLKAVGSRTLKRADTLLPVLRAINTGLEKEDASAEKGHSERLLLVRFVQLQRLKGEYSAMVDEAILPGGVSLDLAQSIDVAMDNLGVPIYDWRFLVTNIFNVPLLMRFAPALAKSTWGRRLLVHRLRAFEGRSLFTLRSFILAHERVQKVLEETLNVVDADVSRPEVAQCVAESKLAVAEARRFLRNFLRALDGDAENVAPEHAGYTERNLFAAVRAWQLAAKLTSSITHHVHDMIGHGLLSPAEADTLLFSILAEDELRLRRGLLFDGKRQDPQAVLETLTRLLAQREKAEQRFKDMKSRLRWSNVRAGVISSTSDGSTTIVVDTTNDGHPDTVLRRPKANALPGLKPVPNSSSATARRIYVDTKGSGIADHIAIDTTGDGIVDTLIAAQPGDIGPDVDTVVSLPVDTVGDGKADHIAIDTTGDGRVDTILKLSTSNVSTDKLPKLPPSGKGKIPLSRSWGGLPQMPTVLQPKVPSMPMPMGSTRPKAPTDVTQLNKVNDTSPKTVRRWDWAPSVKSDYIARPERQVVAEIPDDVLHALRGSFYSPQPAPRDGPKLSTIPSASSLPVAMHLSDTSLIAVTTEESHL